MKNKDNLIISSVIIGVAMIIAVMVGAYAFITARGFDNTLTVTGSATQDVVADSAKWSFSLSEQGVEGDLQSATARLGHDLDAAKKFLSQNGVADADITITPVMTDEVYKYNSDQNGPRQFNVHQTITVQSNDPASIEKLSKASNILSAQGILVMIDQPQYFISNLPDLRIQLLGAAISDARARADQIAGSAHTKVGALKSASSGVVQVMPPNSVDVSDYGQYDTSTINKSVMVTVHATFFVK